MRHSLMRLARRLWLSSAAAWAEYAILQWPLDGLARFRAWFGRWTGQVIRRYGPARVVVALIYLATWAAGIPAILHAFGVI